MNAQVNDGPPPHFPGDFSAFIGTWALWALSPTVVDPSISAVDVTGLRMVETLTATAPSEHEIVIVGKRLGNMRYTLDGSDRMNVDTILAPDQPWTLWFACQRVAPAPTGLAAFVGTWTCADADISGLQRIQKYVRIQPDFGTTGVIVRSSNGWDEEGTVELWAPVAGTHLMGAVVQDANGIVRHFSADGVTDGTVLWTSDAGPRVRIRYTVTLSSVGPVLGPLRAAKASALSPTRIILAPRSNRVMMGTR